MELYVNWFPKMGQESLAIIRESGLIDGIELSNTDTAIDIVQRSGLKVACHCPGFVYNLADPEFELGPEELDAITISDAPFVSFHLGYSADKIYKMKSFPNQPKSRPIDSSKELADRIEANLGPYHFGRKLLLESMDYSETRPVPWDIQPRKAKKHKKEIQARIDRWGINTGLQFCTQPEFITDMLDRLDAGFLFDVAHVMISATAHKDEYYDKMIECLAHRTYQMHLSCPESTEYGLADMHKPFDEKDELGSYVLAEARGLITRTPRLAAITLEIDTGLSGTKHAHAIVEQADYILRKIA